MAPMMTAVELVVQTCRSHDDGTKNAESRFHNYLCRIGFSLQSQLSFFGTHPFLFFKNLPVHFSIVNLLLFWDYLTFYFRFCYLSGR